MSQLYKALSGIKLQPVVTSTAILKVNQGGVRTMVCARACLVYVEKTEALLNNNV